MVQHIVHSISRWRLYLAVVIVNLLFVSTGCVLTWPSPVLPKLLLPEEEGSWVSSISAIGGALGPIVNSFFMPFLGRKTILLGNGVIFLVSWAILMTGTNFASMMVGRLLGGLGVGLSFLCVPLYITEAADNEVRQAVTSLTEFFIGIGYLLVYGWGPYLSYFQLQLYSFLAVSLFLVPFIFLPESPYYLVSKGKREKAAKSLAWFRGVDPSQVDQELDQIEKHFSFQNAQSGKKSKLEVIRNKGYRKALILGISVLFIQQMSGICVVTSFTEPILAEAGLPFAASTGAILFGVVSLFSAAFAPPIVRRFGSKRVLVFCNVIMTLSLYVYSGYMYCEVHDINVSNVNVLPVVALVVYNCFFCIGGGPLPWSLVAELSPQEFRGFNSCVIATFSWSVSFGLMRAFAPARIILGDWVVFAFFAVSLTLGTIFIILALPNTRGLSLAQVQKLLAGEDINKKEDQSGVYQEISVVSNL